MREVTVGDFACTTHRRKVICGIITAAKEFPDGWWVQLALGDGSIFQCLASALEDCVFIEPGKEPQEN